MCKGVLHQCAVCMQCMCRSEEGVELPTVMSLFVGAGD